MGRRWSLEVKKILISMWNLLIDILRNYIYSLGNSSFGFDLSLSMKHDALNSHNFLFIFVEWKLVIYLGTRNYDTICIHDISNVWDKLKKKKTLVSDVTQPYQLQVHNVFVMAGNVAVLRCNIPSFVRGLVQVSNWMKDEHLLGRTVIHPGGR